MQGIEKSHYLHGEKEKSYEKNDESAVVFRNAR